MRPRFSHKGPVIFYRPVCRRAGREALLRFVVGPYWSKESPGAARTLQSAEATDLKRAQMPWTLIRKNCGPSFLLNDVQYRSAFPLQNPSGVIREKTAALGAKQFGALQAPRHRATQHEARKSLAGSHPKQQARMEKARIVPCHGCWGATEQKMALRKNEAAGVIAKLFHCRELREILNCPIAQ